MIWLLWERGYKLKKEKKGQVIAELRNEFDKAKAVIFTDYRGLTVAELSELRRLLRDRDIKYRVVKNTLAKIASQDTPVSGAKDIMKGPAGIAISHEDPVMTVKKILGYSKKNEKLRVTSGIIEGKLCAVEDIRAIAELPPREVQLSILAGVFQASISKCLAALNAMINSFAYAMNALKTKREA
ncbi:MAG: 50S ribosomal protein L10 [Nitrospirota bacterium]|nr:50S ribosomal protein L10 [Nitrospirota bacterium]MDH5769189.1 50S ribosomal protein L10 [Nitrospirota bacterium]